jgi:hypothetical protein
MKLPRLFPEFDFDIHYAKGSAIVRGKKQRHLDDVW